MGFAGGTISSSSVAVERRLQRESAFQPNTKLGTCPSKLCKAAAQKTGRSQRWQYSFEAECLLYAQPECSSHVDEGLCAGVDVSSVHALEHGEVSHHEPQPVLDMLQQLADCIQARPAFAEMFNAASNKLEFVERVQPYLYEGTCSGMRSAFCEGQLPKGSSKCKSCERSQAIFSDSAAMDTS